MQVLAETSANHQESKNALFCLLRAYVPGRSSSREKNLA
jgi:hypothetical protein